jgi:hypothetical protein
VIDAHRVSPSRQCGNPTYCKDQEKRVKSIGNTLSFSLSRLQ